MMEHSLITQTISHFGLDNQSPLEARRKAGLLFSRVLNRGKWRTFCRRLLRREYQLRSLAQVAGDAKRQPPKQRGVRLVPLAKIIGSEGRTRDFDNAFNPLSAHCCERWIGIAVARRRGSNLPPIDLIQVGDAYYVRDGHHRVSVAKAAGQADIEAQICYVLLP